MCARVHTRTHTPHTHTHTHTHMHVRTHARTRAHTPTHTAKQSNHTVCIPACAQTPPKTNSLCPPAFVMRTLLTKQLDAFMMETALYMPVSTAACNVEGAAQQTILGHTHAGKLAAGAHRATSQLRCNSPQLRQGPRTHGIGGAARFVRQGPQTESCHPWLHCPSCHSRIRPVKRQHG